MSPSGPRCCADPNSFLAGHRDTTLTIGPLLRPLEQGTVFGRMPFFRLAISSPNRPVEHRQSLPRPGSHSPESSKIRDEYPNTAH